MTPERALWQEVVLRAFLDATNDFNPRGNSEGARAKRHATFWISHGGTDYYRVCNLAGFDPDFMREAFLAGRVDAAMLRSASKAL